MDPLFVIVSSIILDGVETSPATDIVHSLLLLVIGGLRVIKPSMRTRLTAQFGAGGSTLRMSEIEPPVWKVWVTRALGIGMLAGAIWLLVGP
ncbi:hypothetical protein [Halocatena marina]|uniref:hypothetical protein n=1 Tax=Halocatena marina TaxID=2934937 RepID=UPI00200FEF55|nr:hypothetical protein [Halocatena marina]